MKEIHVKEGPFIKTDNKAINIMKTLLISLIPIILFSVYKNGFIPFQKGKTDILGLIYPLIFIVLGASTSGLTEYLYSTLMQKEKNKSLKANLNKFSIFPGLFLSLLLPINTPIWLLILAALIATLLGKMIWGGLGYNKLNPALVGYLFVIIIMFLGLKDISYLNNYELESIANGMTPLENILSLKSISDYDTLVKPSGSLWDFFFGTVPGGLGTTSVILSILAYLYLTYKKALKWRIPLIYIGTVFIVTYFIGFLNDVGLWYPTIQILSGSLIFCAVFMATDPVTSPVTPTGQVVYGMGLGILTVIFRFVFPFEYGIIISILIMNALVPLIDRVGAQARFDFKKVSILMLVEMVVILALSLYIAEIKNDEVPTDEKSLVLQE